MKSSNLKYYIGIIFIIILDSLHIILFNNNDKYDVYLFYNHERYLTNILYDISNLFKFSVLTYFLSHYNKIVFKPLFALSLIIWLSYFVYYNQIGSLLLIPIYILLIIFYRVEWKDK